MTTIAYDGKTLAVDSRISSLSSISSDNYMKLFKLESIDYFGDQLLYIALSGNVSDMHKFTQQIKHKGTIFTGDKKKVELWGIILGQEFNYYLDPGLKLVAMPKKEHLAEGSGRDFALSAMSLGLDAVAAVKHAMKFDAATGGKVESVFIGGKK